MASTRNELETALASLDKAVAALLCAHSDPDEFWPAFAGIADEIVDRAGAEDCDWVHERIDLILASRGLDRQES